MRHVVDPRQTRLFDPYKDILSDVAYRRIRDGWPGVFRHVILELMPVKALAGAFHPTMGTPTKELYSMAGLLLIKEFRNWTTTEATEAYLFHADVQYALNLAPCGQSLCERTIERYEAIFVESDLAAATMERVTSALVKALDLDVSRQRLDSTHVFSDMAQFGRTRMMGVTIQRFLTQLKRHDRAGYEALPDALRSRYAPSPGRMFADASKNADARHRLRQEVAEDLRRLIERFADAPEVQGRSTYRAMVKVFGEQCTVVGDTTLVKAHPGNAITQNPSDLGATRDGHKGPGYQAQIAETCSPQNDVQLLTAVLPQTAADDDRDAMPAVLDKLEADGRLPEMLYADTHYGADASEQACAARGVDLQAPVAGLAPKGDEATLTLDDFVADEATETLTGCPSGHAPLSSERDAASGTTRTEMPAAACAACPHRDACPVRCVRGRYRLDHTAAERRLAARRREQETEAFKEHYRIRAGLESTNGGLKRRLGFGRLRCRGRPKVFYTMLMKACGWNVLRASASEKLRRRVAEIMRNWGLGSPVGACLRLIGCLSGLPTSHERLLRRNPGSPAASAFGLAA